MKLGIGLPEDAEVEDYEIDLDEDTTEEVEEEIPSDFDKEEKEEVDETEEDL